MNETNELLEYFHKTADMGAGNEVGMIIAHLLDDRGSGLGFHSDRIGCGGEEFSAACVDLNGMIAHNAGKHSHRRIDLAVCRRGAGQHQIEARRKVKRGGSCSRRNGARYFLCRGKVISRSTRLELFGVLGKIALQVGGRQRGEPVVQRLAGSALFPFKKSLERRVVSKAAVIAVVLDHAIGRDGIARHHAFKGHGGIRHRGDRKSGGRQADGQHKRQKECAEFSQMLFHSVLPFLSILSLSPQTVFFQTLWLIPHFAGSRVLSGDLRGKEESRGTHGRRPQKH